MKTVSPTLFALSVALGLHAAEAPPFEWALPAGGPTQDKTRCVNVDAQGNVVFAGEFNGPAKFGTTELAGAGQMDYFVAKADVQGHVLWAHSGGGSGVDRGYAVATDAKGNVYTAGHYQSADATFDGTKLPPAANYDAFIAKYSPEGKLLWVRTAGSPGYDYAHGIAVDAKGNVVVTGAIAATAVFGEYKIERPIGSHIFCAKYDAAGKLQWVKATTGAASNSANGVAVDGAGNIYIGGATSGVGQFGEKELKTAKGQDALVAKLNADGDVLWVATNHGETSCLNHEITCDAQGRVWTSGMFKGKASFGADTFQSSSEKDSDAFIAHFDTGGKLQWARVGQSSGTDYGLGVATDGAGNSFLTGEFSDTFTLSKNELTSRGGTDIFVAAFGKDGALQWLAQAGGPQGDNAYSMVYDPRGGLVLGGAISGTATFDPLTVTSSGSSDLFIAKLKLSPKARP